MSSPASTSHTSGDPDLAPHRSTRVAWGLSIRSKILLGFVVVLLSSGAATFYGAWAVRTLGQQLRLVALGYSALRLQLQDQQTLQANLQRRLAEPDASPRFTAAVAADRKRRRIRLQGARQHVQDLRRSLPAADAEFLNRIDAGLAELERLYAATDTLEQANAPSPTSDDAPAMRDGHSGSTTGSQAADVRELEDRATQLLEQMSTNLTNKVVEVVSVGERHEKRAVWMTILLALAAAITGGIVLLLVQATLRPLRRLADSAKEVARGNYQVWQVWPTRRSAHAEAGEGRVAADSFEASPDEVGELAREFRSMAAALEEREGRLRRSEQLAAVGKMAAQITHEVRNPLTAIGLNAELLADEFAGRDGEAQALALAIVKEVDRLTQITEQYLRFARLPAPHFERTDLNDLLRSLLQFAGEDLRSRGITVDLQLDDKLPALGVDEGQLRQALLNLIRNASEAMTQGAASDDDAPRNRPGRRLLIRSRSIPATEAIDRAKADDGSPSARRVAIDVIDSGPGISKAHQQQIFEPFFTTKRGGTGLGLALALEVVTRHGGQLRVESPTVTAGDDGPAYGTRFTVELPCDELPR